MGTQFCKSCLYDVGCYQEDEYMRGLISIYCCCYCCDSEELIRYILSDTKFENGENY
jgi:hypothetical protein